MTDSSTAEKGGAAADGVRLLLCENPLPPIDEAIAAATNEVPHSNHYTEPYSNPLREVLADRLGVRPAQIHVNAGSELILRQLFDRFGQHVHLLTPTYPLFTEIAEQYTETRLQPETDFQFDLRQLDIPDETTLAVIVNPNNPNGDGFDMRPLPDLLETNPETRFLVDEAFVDFVDESVAHLVPEYDNLFVTQTLSKAHSLAGFRIGYAILPEPIADELNANNDAYPLTRPSQAAAIATIEHESKIRARIDRLQSWTTQLADDLESLGVTTFPSETYFFLADFSPHDAHDIAAQLRERNIVVKPLENDRLGPGYMRVTTSRPEDNERVVGALAEIL